jgi:adenylate cyclase
MTKWWSVLPVIFLLAFLKVSQYDIVKSVEYVYYDFLQRNHDIVEVDDIVLVNIDERAIEKEGQYPWPRQTVAKYINQAPNNSLLVSTMIWSEKDRFAGDQELSASLSQKAVILASAPTRQTTTDDLGIYANVSTFGKPKETLIDYTGLLAPIPELAQYSMGVGAVSAEVDQPTGVLRRMPLMVGINGQPYPSLGLDAVRVFLGEPSYTVKYNELGVEWIRLGRQAPLITQPTSELPITFWNKFKSQSILDPIPEGKVVILGVTAEGVANPVPTPVGAMYPHEVQGQQIQTLISGVQILRPDWTVAAELAMILIMSLSILVAVYKLPTIFAVIVSLGALLSLPLFGFYVWREYYFFLDVIWASLAGLLVFGQSSFNQYYTTYKLKEQIKKQFGTYLSPDMVAALQKDPSLLKLGGERKEMTFLFMDICGFTPISEHYKNNNDPEGLVDLINEYLDAMTKIILNNGGTIDKYMGDCIMAFWNAPLACDNHAEMAVKSAIEIEVKTNDLKEIYKERGLPDINVGTGINTGDCIVGNMGSESRFDYSVIGDAVNLAARLEATAARHEYKEYKTIISSFTRDLLPAEYKCEKIGDIKVKGKEDLITIYSPKL